MGVFASLSVAIRTANERFSGTGARPWLVVNQRGADRINCPLFAPVTVGELKRGQSIYTMHSLRDMPRTELSDDQVNSGEIYTRVVTTSTDLWRPDLIMVWGWSRERKTIPLALDLSPTFTLSLDPREGVSSGHIRHVAKGDGETPIEKLLLIVVTYAAPYAGTDDPIWLRVVTPDGPAVHQTISDTPQTDLEINTSNIYEVPVSRPFTKKEVQDDAGEIRLGIHGSDKWVPRTILLFGLSGGTDPDLVVPLVRLCDPGPLSADPTKGAPSFELPVE